MNESITAPEMRYLRSVLGELKGKELLDLGCGLGEASVYFALEGASVTAADLSEKMLAATRRLAEKYSVTVKTHLSAAENLKFDSAARFDVIYCGNLLHHVDIDSTLQKLLPHLKPEGMFISWDPVAYNPVINVYRRMASQVRTPDEHPLKLADIACFEKYFSEVKTRWFWLTTLFVFIAMYVFQRRNPNQERFWKKVVEEGDQWAWLYRPLEKLDRFLLVFLPFLKPLCWNVVIVATKPKQGD
ncbi:MAG TPA: class I SAM-dependent methyltransferase [Candidatus Omnitrophota bacterium]|nr:class I SAM-dependent methyltransferase [Candidatus Omnitrophota bacterium]